jgi:transposase-like protein
LRFLVGVTGRYSNRSDLLEQLRKVAVILLGDRGDGAAGTGEEPVMVSPMRSYRLRDRFSPGVFRAMIELYGSGATVQQVAERFGASESSVKRLLRQNTVTRPARSLCDRFSPEDLQTMIDLYRSGTTARQVAEKFEVSERSIKRLLHRHGVRRERVE